MLYPARPPLHSLDQSSRNIISPDSPQTFSISPSHSQNFLNATAPSCSNRQQKFSTSFASLTTNSSLATTAQSAHSYTMHSHHSNTDKRGSTMLSTSTSKEIDVPVPPYRSLLSPQTNYDYKPRSYTKTNTAKSNASSNFGTITTTKQKMEYKSLLTPINSTTKKIFDAASDTLSIRSFKSSKSFFSLTTNSSSASSKKTPLNFLSLPDEIILLIFENLLKDKKPLIFLLYVSKRISLLAKIILYSRPKFTSTYRLGQFIHTINVTPNLALLVKKLDLSNLAPGVDNAKYQEYLANPFYVNGGNTNDDFEWNYEDTLGSWRDWRYRNHSLYGNVDTTLYKVTSSTEPRNEFRKRERRNSLPSLPSYSTTHSKSNPNLILKSSSPYSKPSPAASTRRTSLDQQRSSSSKYLKSSSISNPKASPFTRSSLLGPAVSSKSYPDPHKYLAFSTPHPRQNRFLLKYSFSKDIPIGYVLHLLKECTNLESLDLSNLSISTDYTITDFETFDYENSTGKVKLKKTCYPDGTFSGSMLIDDTTEEEKLETQLYYERYKVVKPIYWSDTTREIEDKNIGSSFIKLNYSDILKELSNLKFLRDISLRSIVWISRQDIFDLFNNSKSVQFKELEFLDCTDSGMTRSSDWASKRSFKEWRRYIREYNSNTAVSSSPPTVLT